eukprot:2952604-Rhodomonas_salina.1
MLVLCELLSKVHALLRLLASDSCPPCARYDRARSDHSHSLAMVLLSLPDLTITMDALRFSSHFSLVCVDQSRCPILLTPACHVEPTHLQNRNFHQALYCSNAAVPCITRSSMTRRTRPDAMARVRARGRRG